MRILNLYAGIGGNRALWNGHQITAIEKDPIIADCYKAKFARGEEMKDSEGPLILTLEGLEKNCNTCDRNDNSRCNKMGPSCEDWIQAS